VIWIHGGSYENGGPQNASAFVELAKDVVWVSINYRMGWAGFLGGEQLRSRDPHRSTGNYGIQVRALEIELSVRWQLSVGAAQPLPLGGCAARGCLQDQREAMRWVRANIASFGGDARRITIDGCSAGAGSVAVHMTNNRSYAFYDQAGGQSGIIAQWNSLPMSAAQLFYDLFTQAAGCASAACLETKTTDELAAAATKAWSARTAQPTFDGSNNYSPVVDGVELLATPRESVLRGHTFEGPVLLGTAADEVCSLEGHDFSFSMSEAAFKADTEQEYAGSNISVGQVLALYGQPPGQPNASCGCGTPQLPMFCFACKKQLGRYSPWWWAAIERGSDFGFHCPARQFARKFNLGPTFLYTYMVMKQQFPGLWCVPHCSELSSILFGATSADPSTPAGRLLLATAAYRISFLRHGDPNVDRLESSPEWPTYSERDESMVLALEDAGDVHVRRGYRRAPCEYWETLPGGPD
jgi:para-nitrobenzyl esterase